MIIEAHTFYSVFDIPSQYLPSIIHIKIYNALSTCTQRDMTTAKLKMMCVQMSIFPMNGHDWIHAQYSENGKQTIKI